MKLSERAIAEMEAADQGLMQDRIHKEANSRKREVYWIGFLEGALASRRIEDGEEGALLAEAEKFADFFDDPDAIDLAEDLKARCFSGEADLIDQLKAIIADKRAVVKESAPYGETDTLNEFLGYAAGIVCDGRVLESEARAILRRFRSDQTLMAAKVFHNLRRAVEVAMDDDALTPEESEDVREWIARLVGDGFIDTGVPNIGNTAKPDAPITDPSELHFEGACFVLTGPMRMGPRAFITSEIERLGGEVRKTVSKKVDYVVISSNASKDWKTTHFGTKIERAQGLIAEGHQIRFVSEYALEKAATQVA